MNSFFSSRVEIQDVYATLLKAGFTKPEITRLLRLQRKWKPGQQDRASLDPDPAHLCFLRWLFERGRLTEELSE